MNKPFERLLGCSLLVLGLAIGCGDDDGGDDPNDAGGDAGQGGRDASEPPDSKPEPPTDKDSGTPAEKDSGTPTPTDDEDASVYVPKDCDLDPCGSHGSCNDSTGEVVCTCDYGYEDDGGKCVEAPTCDDDDCHPLATCVDHAGVARTCECPDAYSGDGIGDHGCTAGALTLFEPFDVLDVEVTLADADWEIIRYEGRTLGEVFSGCDKDTDYDGFSAYTWVAGDVTVNGEERPGVRVRKKGYLGSISYYRPSIKVDFETDDGSSANDTVFGARGLVLNNNRQDDSNARACLAYSVFRAAGLPAPHCNFANVTINGQDEGIYTHVEAIKKPFLRSEFPDGDGTLYEGQVADFDEKGLPGFEKKTNELDATGNPDPTTPELDAVADALAIVDDAAMLTALKEVIDFDKFLTFWAVESLISHWDGYNGDNNNFYVYAPKTTGKIVFIPWGADGAFDRDHAFLPETGRPKSVFVDSLLARRLYEYPVTQELYRAELQRVLDEVWNEPQLIADLKQIVDVTGANPEGQAAAVREFIGNRRSELEMELAQAPIEWPFEPLDVPVCDPDLAQPASGAFETTWGADFAPSANSTLTVQHAGTNYVSFYYLAQAVPGVIQVFAAGFMVNPDWMAGDPVEEYYIPDGSALVVTLLTGPAPIAPGTLKLHGFEIFGVTSYSADGAAPTPTQPFAYESLIGDGEIVLEQAGTNPGDPLASPSPIPASAIKGTFTGRSTPFGLDVE